MTKLLMHTYILLASTLLENINNKFGENNSWHQANVERFFSKDELLIGKDYWNFVCNDEHGFDIVFDQYKISSQYIKDALTRIRNKYGC